MFRMLFAMNILLDLHFLLHEHRAKLRSAYRVNVYVAEDRTAGNQNGETTRVFRLKILHTEAAVQMGGQEIYTYRHMLAMRERGHEMFLLCQAGTPLAKRAQEAGFTVFTLPMGGMGNLVRGIPQVRRLVREHRFDVVNTTSRRDTLIAAAGARLAGAPLVVRFRHLMNPINSLLTYTWLPHRLLTVSDYVKDYMVGRGIPRERIGIASPCVILPEQRLGGIEALPAKGAALRREAREAWGVAEDDVVVGCVAILRPAKGHADLLASMEPLFQRHPHLHLVIVGDGDAAIQQLLEARVVALGLARRVHFLGYRSDVADLLFGFDVFALATRQDASGTVFLEAAGANLPIVATQVGGVPEMVSPGENALLCPLDDHAAMTGALETLVQDVELRQRMGQAGGRWVRGQTRFSQDGQAALIEQYYLQWLKERQHEIR